MASTSDNHANDDTPRQSVWPYPKRDDEIHPDQAKYLFERHCALLIIEALPVGSEFGIDLASFRVGDKFKGVKLIPPGVHFVFASAIDKKTNQAGPRCGFYHNFESKELLIKRWSVLDEEFDDTYEVSEEERERYLTNLHDLDRYLGAYRFSTYETFLGLTNKLTAEFIDDLIPISRKIRSITYLERREHRNTANSSGRPKRRTLRADDDLNPSEENLLPEMRQPPDSVIRFTEISQVQISQQLPTNLVTQYNLDSTMKLEQTFGLGDDDKASGGRLLAEFQFAFMTLILGHVYDCFEHWRDLLMLVCAADSALVRYPNLFVEFSRILYRQLEQVPEDLFVDISQADNLIRHHLDILIQNVEQESGRVPIELRELVAQLKLLAEQKFGWIFELERDDEQPVIVEL